jgi:hypothetical protein
MNGCEINVQSQLVRILSHLSVKAKQFETFKIKFQAKLWISIKKEHLELLQLATSMLLLSGMTYLCEDIFSNGSN